MKRDGGVQAVSDCSHSDLVKRAQQGDADAFARIFQLHKSNVYAICLRMTSNTAEAEDLAQDAFLQVFRKLATFRGESAFSTWLYRVAVNTVLMHFRKRELQQISLDQPLAAQDGTTSKREYGRIDAHLSSSTDRLALRRAIASLPLGYRTIFVMHEVDGYGHREIARILRCSIGNSKSQLHKAKSKVREFLSFGPSEPGVRTRKARKTAKPIAAAVDNRSPIEIRSAADRVLASQAAETHYTPFDSVLLESSIQPAA
jgi:RNA polymerase sigma-70 factor (ECF subfamily)